MSTVDFQFTNFDGFSPTLKRGPYRAKDYWELPEGAPYELMRGELVLSPSPRSSHQIIIGRLFKILQAVEEREGGVCLLSPMDVILSDDTILQPDLLYVSKDRRDIIGDRVNGPPDVVIEVLSPRAERRDRVQKLALYAEYGVPEFWIVDQTAQWIEFLILKDGAYVVTQPAEGRYQSPRLPEVAIDLANFWKEVAERLPAV
jgi:Uma2 family endonuclease